MKIVVDAFGGDNAPDEIVKGAVASLRKEIGFSVVLVGERLAVEKILSGLGEYPLERLEIIDAKDVISNDDSPTDAIRTKPQSSLVRALDYLNENEDAKGFVSAGNTGAVLTGAVLMLKRIRGVNRPALSPLLPTVSENEVLLIDCGANVEPKPLNLLQFALMGSAFMKSVKGISAPRVGLLSNGTEEKKGSSLVKESFSLLKESNIKFCGNMEAREILSGEFDVVVSDGFSGNIALKASEGTALSMFSLIKQGILAGGLRAKIGYLLLKPVFKGVKKKMDYNESGGAVLLGLTKIVIKSHGSSKEKSITNSILQAKRMVDAGVVEKITEELCVGN